MELAAAVENFLQETARHNRAEATRAKYTLTLNRLLEWCAAQHETITFPSQLDVATLRRWIQTWEGAPTTRHNQHQRVITFFFFCIELGWVTENPAKKIKKVTAEQDETLPFTREQFDALIEATHFYDSRDPKKASDTVNSRRAQAYLKLLRWSGLSGRSKRPRGIPASKCSALRFATAVQLRPWSPFFQRLRMFFSTLTLPPKSRYLGPTAAQCFFHLL